MVYQFKSLEELSGYLRGRAHGEHAEVVRAFGREAKAYHRGRVHALSDVAELLSSQGGAQSSVRAQLELPEMVREMQEAFKERLGRARKNRSRGAK